jgi:hypothetical protein
MAACYESVTFDRCNALLAFAAGMKVSKVWQSTEPCVFLELGRLTDQPAVRGKRVCGQAALMIESHWRVERSRSIHFGSSFSQRRLARLLPGLVKLRVERLCVDPVTRELAVQLSDRRVFRTFTDWDTQPHWTVLAHDRSLVAMDPVWNDADVTPCLYISAGRPLIEYCFDPTEVDMKALRRLYRFPRGSG